MTRNEYDRDRDNVTGQWRSDAYADQHPDETTSELVESTAVTPEMVTAATDEIVRITASGPATWWSDPAKVEAVVRAAVAARRGGA